MFTQNYQAALCRLPHSAIRDCVVGQTARLVVGTLLLVMGLLLFFAGELWSRFHLRHLARVIFDPIKIVFTYSQITCQVRHARNGHTLPH